MEDNPGWEKAKPLERRYIKYEPKNNLPTHEYIVPNHIDKGLKSLESAVCVNNEANKKLTTPQKDLL